VLRSTCLSMENSYTHSANGSNKYKPRSPSGCCIPFTFLSPG